METHQDTKRDQSVRFSGARLVEEIKQVISCNGAVRQELEEYISERQQRAGIDSVEPRSANAEDAEAVEADAEDAKAEAEVTEVDADNAEGCRGCRWAEEAVLRRFCAAD